jgi:hypothetical protein
MSSPTVFLIASSIGAPANPLQSFEHNDGVASNNLSCKSAVSDSIPSIAVFKAETHDHSNLHLVSVCLLLDGFVKNDV